MLKQAIQQNDLIAARRLLNEGINPNGSQRSFCCPTSDPEMGQPLIGANIFPTNELLLSLAQSPEMVQLLLEHLADPNLTDRKGQTVLHLMNDPILLAPILQYNIDVNHLDNDGNAPLHTHCQDPAMVQFLLNHHADPNITNKNDETVLHLTTSTEVIQHILNAGCDPNMVAQARYTDYYCTKDLGGAFLLLCFERLLTTLIIVLIVVATSSTCADHPWIVFSIASTVYASTVLLMAKIVIQSILSRGFKYRPIHRALQVSGIVPMNQEQLDLLLQNGADQDGSLMTLGKPDSCWKCKLSFAPLKNYLPLELVQDAETARVLIQHGARPTMGNHARFRDKFFDDPVIMARYVQTLDSPNDVIKDFRKLINTYQVEQSVADVYTNYLLTLNGIHRPTHSHLCQMTNLLSMGGLERGPVREYMRRDLGIEPVLELQELSQLNEDQKVRKMLTYSPDVLERLFNYGANPLWKTTDGKTLLHLSDQPNVIQMVLIYTPDHDYNGDHPMLTHCQNPDIVQLFLNHHTDVNTTNNYQENLLHLTTSTEVFNLALNAGIDVNSDALRPYSSTTYRFIWDRETFADAVQLFLVMTVGLICAPYYIHKRLNENRPPHYTYKPIHRPVNQTGPLTPISLEQLQLLINSGAHVTGTLRSQCQGPTFWVRDSIVSFRHNPETELSPIQLAVEEPHILLLFENGATMTNDVFTRLNQNNPDLLETLERFNQQMSTPELLQSLQTTLQNGHPTTHIITRILAQDHVRPFLNQILKMLLLNSANHSDIIRVLRAGACPNADLDGTIYHIMSYDQMELVVQYTKYPIDLRLWSRNCKLTYKQIHKLVNLKNKISWELIKLHHLMAHDRAFAPIQTPLTKTAKLPMDVLNKVLAYM